MAKGAPRLFRDKPPDDPKLGDLLIDDDWCLHQWDYYLDNEPGQEDKGWIEVGCFETLADAEAKANRILAGGDPWTDDNPRPAGQVINLEMVSATLTRMADKLTEATTVSELDAVQRSADAFRHVLRLAKFDLQRQNRFFAIRARGLRRIGDILLQMEKHKGGRPSGNPSMPPTGFPTLNDLGISRDFASECQRIARMPIQEFDAYLALGQSADDLVERDPAKPLWQQPVELTKRGLLDWAEGWIGRRWTENRNTEQAERVYREAETAKAAPPKEEPDPSTLTPSYWRNRSRHGNPRGGPVRP